MIERPADLLDGGFARGSVQAPSTPRTAHRPWKRQARTCQGGLTGFESVRDSTSALLGRVRARRRTFLDAPERHASTTTVAPREGCLGDHSVTPWSSSVLRRGQSKALFDAPTPIDQRRRRRRAPEGTGRPTAPPSPSTMGERCSAAAPGPLMRSRTAVTVEAAGGGDSRAHSPSARRGGGA